MDIIIYFLNFYIKELIEDFNDFIKDANKYPAGKENIAEIIEKQYYFSNICARFSLLT